MALNSKRRIAALTGVLAVALTATACGSSDSGSGSSGSASGGKSSIDCAPYKAFGDLKGKTVSVYTSITAPEDAPHQASYKPFEVLPRESSAAPDAVSAPERPPRR